MTCEVETLMVLSYKYQDIKLQIPVGQLPDFCGPYKIHKINIYVRNLRVVFVLTLFLWSSLKYMLIVINTTIKMIDACCIEGS